MAWPEIRLTDLHVPGAKTTDANAIFDPNTRRWSAQVAVEDLTHLTPWGVKSLDLRLNAAGRRSQGIHLRASGG